MVMKVEKDKNIRCNVHSCKHCNCNEDLCKLREIEIKKQSGCSKPCDAKETICSSFEKEE